jgi:hypothetical protein
VLPLVGQGVTLRIVLVVGASGARSIGDAGVLTLQGGDPGRGDAPLRAERGADASMARSHAYLLTTDVRDVGPVRQA